MKLLANAQVFCKIILRKSLLPEIGLLSGLLESNRFQSRLEEARVAPSCAELRVYYPVNQRCSIFKKLSRSTFTITVNLELALFVVCLFLEGGKLDWLVKSKRAFVNSPDILVLKHIKILRGKILYFFPCTHK